MNKAIGIVLAVVVAIVALGFGGRAYANRAMSTRSVTPKPLGTETPATVGVPFSRVAVETGDRTLIGWWVRARADSGKAPPALLFLHGNRSSISDYVALQKFLYRQGISSLVFDYSGFGASGGSPSLKNAIADAASVARVFADSAGKGARRVAMGSALGSTVLLQAIDSVQPHVDGVVIEGVAASVRESAVRDGKLPKLVAPLLVDVGDNVSAATHVKVPLLAVHSYADNRFPIEDAQRVVSAVPGRAALVRHWRKGHSALLTSTKPCDWEPIIKFVKSGTLPASKVDSTDACAAAQLAAAAAAAAAKTVTSAGGVAATKATGTKAPSTKKQSTATKTTSTKSAATKTLTKKPLVPTTKKAATKKAPTATKRP